MLFQYTKTGYVLRVTVLIHIQKYIRATTRPSSQLSASRERRLPTRDLSLKKKPTCMYEMTLYMPHVPGQPPTHHLMQVPMRNQYRVSPDSHHTTRSLCDIYFIVSCHFGQQNFPGSHRGSLTPFDIFRAFTDGYAV